MERLIRRAEGRDIDAVEQSYIDLLTHEEAQGGHSGWVLGVYPTRQVAETALQAGTLYVLEEDGLCASMILNQVEPQDYRQIPWAYAAGDEQVLVIHTLCVPPAKAGRGYAGQMVRYALAEASARGMKALRLDTYAQNIPAASLYKKMGFRYAGSAQVLFQGCIPQRQIFFEIKVQPQGEGAGLNP